MSYDRGQATQRDLSLKTEQLRNSLMGTKLGPINNTTAKSMAPTSAPILRKKPSPNRRKRKKSGYICPSRTHQKKIQCWLPWAEWRKLRLYAAERGLTISAAVAQILATYPQTETPHE